MKSIQHNQGGFSLVEILLVLGIIAILAIAAFIIFPQVQASNRANSEQSNITTIAAGTKNLYASTRNYLSVNNNVLNQARIFPPSMNGGVFNTGTPITSSWSRQVTVEPSEANGDNQTSTVSSEHFRITYTAMPAEVCTKLVPGLVQNFVSIYINGVLATTPADIVVECAGGYQDVVDVAFISD